MFQKYLIKKQLYRNVVTNGQTSAKHQRQENTP